MTTTALGPAPRTAAPEADEHLVFPPGFVWGASTSACQVEGASRVDGRGPSIWDTFRAAPGRVATGHSGEDAADFYHRFPRDLDAAARIGATALRFSIAWPRVQPDGAGRIEQRGLAFYDRLVDAMLARDLVPIATLYHWDLPQALQEAGGWTNRDTAYRLAEYALAVHHRLGDRVLEWTTLHEPGSAAFLGHHTGQHAPGVSDPVAALQAAHHLLLGHGLTASAIRSVDPATQLSVVLDVAALLPGGHDLTHRDAVARVDTVRHRMFLEPVLGHGYPDRLFTDTAWLGEWDAVIGPEDEAVIAAAPPDWLGVDLHAPLRVAVDPDPDRTGPWPGVRGVAATPAPATAGTVTGPLRRLHDEYGCPPLVVTVQDGRALLPDLRAVHAAIGAGVPVAGYLHRSLLDEFECGFGQRDGLLHVDFDTQRRTVTDSALLYADVVARNAVPAR